MGFDWTLRCQRGTQTIVTGPRLDSTSRFYWMKDLKRSMHKILEFLSIALPNPKTWDET